MTDAKSKDRRVQTAFNYMRSIKRKFETLRLVAGETDTMRTLTMRSDGRGRHRIAVRVVRESDWQRIMDVVCTAWSTSSESDSGRELLIADAVGRLWDHLEQRKRK